MSFDWQLEQDTLLINEQAVTDKSWQRVHDFLNLVRQQSGITENARVISDNHVPTAAGLASSASAFAALAAAASKASGMDLNERTYPDLPAVVRDPLVVQYTVALSSGSEDPMIRIPMRFQLKIQT